MSYQNFTVVQCTNVDFDEGFAAYQREDYVTALKEWRSLAEQGNAAAQCNLGMMYQCGQGVAQDSKEAATWYRKAAEQGYADAQYKLGVVYSHGGDESVREAAAWYCKAAELGLAAAQSDLGFMYQMGRGVPQDFNKAMMWYQKAAEQGNAMAQILLGMLYALGQGVTQDNTEAMTWYRKAAEQGDAAAQGILGGMCHMLQDNTEAMIWFRKAAEQGLAEMQYRLGWMFANGLGAAKNRVVAYALYSLSAASDSYVETQDDMDELVSSMSEQEIEEGLALMRKMTEPGDLGCALVAYLNSLDCTLGWNV